MVRAALRSERIGFDADASLTLDSFSPPLKVKLLILQATPFCNIDCAYCYLPDRDATDRMTLPVIDATIRNVIDSDLLGERLCIVWHSGEPLAAGAEFYRRAFSCIDSVVDGRCPVHHSIQTNAMLIDQEWCDLFAEHNVRLGVSIDGPASIHDQYRRTRDGKGTHAKAMQGVEYLRRNGLSYHAIAVATALSLQRADEIFHFFLTQEFREVGFNIDEREGAHRRSSIGPAQERDFEAFLQRMLELSKACDGRIRIRELDDARRLILGGLEQIRIGSRSYPRNAQVLPLEILAVDRAGNFSTFSPELLGQRRGEYNDFVFGNVLRDSLASAFSDPAFLRVYRQVAQGVGRCAVACEYFELCGGGAPANKLYENESFDSSETTYCRSVIMAPIRLMLSDLEQRLNRRALSPQSMETPH
jgi:uncharacterized protein